ncbi:MULTISPECIES: glutaredoxin family protein [unclassified Microcystis]|uniref:glutaredoxin family protein n=1 Tax=unclassified Microcystis TaxID=2643300 RepID=UPI0022BD6E67|nr:MULTISPECIES: glutaredoxin family protein [unclassified Microcystis]MCA2692109.1 glutaredoxin family protein [Microcystis sp. M034S2]MCA2749815.1 glutaredoxin family protein [Microcystis sp. M144S2]MCZ8200830.1 glutaredoxin family protein [Microcystis sp. LE19-55.1A]MCZ8308311.1 glutaredoxin family protein [Microcystis sp. LE19-98.1E]
MTTIELILYSKPDCHLCEGLLEKLEKIRQPEWQLEIRDITSREDWFNAYQYEVPVLCQKLATGEKILPRLSPRANAEQLARLLANNLT